MLLARPRQPFAALSRRLLAALLDPLRDAPSPAAGPAGPERSEGARAIPAAVRVSKRPDAPARIGPASVSGEWIEAGDPSSG